MCTSNNKQKSDNLRQSGIELLRIVAIVMVLVCHANARVLGLPSRAEVFSVPAPSIARMLFGAMAVYGVNIFVMISGWFGIHAKPKGLAKLLFEVLFLLWGIYAVFLLTGNATFNMHDIKVCLALTDEYWFVMAYVGLYIFSPVLNAFVEKASKRELQLLLVGFYVFQCYYCWTFGTLDYFSGYSITFFFGPLSHSTLFSALSCPHFVAAWWVGVCGKPCCRDDGKRGGIGLGGQLGSHAALRQPVGDRWCHWIAQCFLPSALP